MSAVKFLNMSRAAYIELYDRRIGQMHVSSCRTEDFDVVN